MSKQSPPPPITVLGRPSCEDTAIVRDRLRALGIPFTDVNIETDSGAADLVESLNDGNRVTPTLLFGGSNDVMAEPSLDDLDSHLVAVGWPVHRPEPSGFTGDLTGKPVPLLALVEAAGSTFRLQDFRGRRQLAVYFAHAADCMACSGYARQLAAVRDRLADAEGLPLIVVPGGPETAARWRAESTSSATIVADHDGRWKRAVGAHTQLDLDGGSALLLALDRYLAPRAGISATDAGGLITPLQAAEWLEFAAIQSN